MTLKFLEAKIFKWCYLCNHRIPIGQKFWYNVDLATCEHANCEENRHEPVMISDDN